MSEGAKRVPLQTLEFPESLGHATKKEKKGEKGKQLAPSFRFTLALPESNEKACPEFNYAQLLKAAEKKRRKDQKRRDENMTNGVDPFDGDDDEDVLRDMAKRFEAKYGTSTMGRKRHKYDDYVDLGAGYDENDSFIDNTDAYDEIVPEEMTTAHEGFYINCGALEFKAAERHSLVHNNNNNNNNNNDEDESSESSEEDTEDVDSPKRDEKRTISSSEDDEVDDIEQPRKKPKIDENGEKKSNHENVIKKKKKQQNHLNQDQQSNAQQEADRQKEKSETTDAEVSEDQEEKKKPDKSDLQKSKATLEKKFDIKKFEKKSSSNGFDAKKLDLKKIGGKDSNIDESIESVVNAARVEDESSRDTTDSTRGILGTESECDDIDKEEAPLPDSLPEDIKEIVNNLKAHAENSKEGKSKFFNTSVNAALFSLEKKLRMLNSASVRPQTYAHLARFLPCSKITLLNRAKKLYLQDAEYKVKEPMQRLKAIIDNVMPSVMDVYIKECQKVADENPQLYWEIYRYCWGFEGSPADAESTEEEESSCKNIDKLKIPRKRFPWTEETKKLVYEIANARRQYFKILRPRKESMESFVATFMDTKVLPLWPPGCVRLQTLLKYSNPAEPVLKKKQKKHKDTVSVNSLPSATNTVCNSTGVLDPSTLNNAPPAQDRAKTPTNVTKILSGIENSTNFSTTGVLKSNDATVDKKQHSSKHKEKIKDSNNTGQQHDVTSIAANSTVGKISVVPTAQLMAQKPVKTHIEKFNLIDLANSSLSITPVNDYHKLPGKTSEAKKDVVSITAYSEPSNILSSISEAQQSGHMSVHRQEALYSSAQAQPSNYSKSSQSSPHSKSTSIKHRILQENTDAKSDKRMDDRDLDVGGKSEKREKRRERCTESKHKSHETKKRKKDQKVIEQQIGPIHSEIISIPQQTSLSKKEQEQRQIEETVAATNFLSQIINEDVSTRSITDKRKDSGLIIDETIGNLVQPTEQEKDVQMVMRSLKELQELQEMKCSPSHSPVSGCGIQKPSKSNAQYVTYQDEYQRLYLKKEDKLRSKEEAQW